MTCHTINSRDENCVNKRCTTPLACDSWQTCRARQFGSTPVDVIHVEDLDPRKEHERYHRAQGSNFNPRGWGR